MTLIFDTTTSKIQDLTPEVNAIDSTFKNKALEVLSRFDFESSLTKDKCKHYPVDYICDGSAEEKAKALELISNACWLTLGTKLREVVVNYPKQLNEEDWETRNKASAVKIGKVYMCAQSILYS